MKNNLYSKRVSKITAFVLIFAMIFSVIGMQSSYAKKTHWADEQMNEWAKKGLLKGDGNGNFRPDDKVTRAEFMTFVNRMMNYTEKSEEVKSFTDVKKSDWYYDEVAKAIKAGYIKGVSEKEIAPTGVITREQAMTILARISGAKTNDTYYEKASDKDKVSKWAKEGVSICIKEGYITGNDGKIMPLDKVTRAQTVVMLNRKLTDTRTFGLAGEYDLENKEVSNIKILSDKITVKNAKVNKDLTVAASVEEGEAKLDNIEVKGNLYAYGGGENSLYFNNLKINGNLLVNKDNGKIRIVFTGETKASNAMLESGATLVNQTKDKKAFEKVEIKSEVKEAQKVELVGTFEKVESAAENLNLKIEGEIKGLKLKENAKITGTGKVKSLEKADKVEVTVENKDGKKIKLDDNTVKLEITSDKLNQDGQSSGSSSFIADDGSTSSSSSTPVTKYELKFNANGGDGAMASQNVPAGKVTLPENKFTKDGFIFGGWATTADGAKAFDDKAEFTMPEENKELFAVWVEAVTVTYKANGATGDDKVEKIAKNGNFTTKAADTFTAPENKEFDSWNTATDGNGIEYTAGQTVENVPADMELHAIWKDKLVTVTYDANGGSGIMAPVKVKAGENHTLPTGGEVKFTAPANKTFEGWHLKQDGSDEKITELPTVTKNVTVYAKWVAEELTITYNANTGTGTIAEGKVNKGEDYTIVADITGLTPPSGKEFVNFNTAQDGSGTSYETGSVIKTVMENTTLYAIWREPAGTDEVIISYNNNGGTGSIDEEKIAKDKADHPAKAVTGFTAPTGKVFDKWNTKADGTGTEVEAGANLSTSLTATNTTLYAIWKDDDTKVVLTYDANGGTGDPKEEAVAKDSATIKVAGTFTAPTGMAFKEWNTTADGTGTSYAADATGKAFTEDTTLYAIWETTEITVTLNLDDGKIGENTDNKELKVAYGTLFKDITDFPTVTKDGHKLVGWKKDNNDINPDTEVITETATYTAKWEAIVVESIAIKSEPTKTQYLKGEKLALAGLEVTLTKSDGTNEDVALVDFTTKSVTTDAQNEDVLGTAEEKTITVTCNNKTATFKVVVKDTVTLTITTKIMPEATVPALNYDAVTVEKGTATDKPEIKTDAGYKFIGFRATEEGTEDFDFKQALNDNTIIFAVYAKLHEVTVEVKGLEDDATAPTYTVAKVANGEKIAEALTGEEVDGYEFKGFKKTESVDGDTFDFATETITADTTIYAMYAPKTYTVSFEVKGLKNGTQAPTYTEITGVQHDKMATAQDVQEVNGHVFLGFKKDEAGTEAFNFYTEKITANTTVYPTYKEIPETELTELNKAAAKVNFELIKGQNQGDSANVTVNLNLVKTITDEDEVTLSWVSKNGAVVVNDAIGTVTRPTSSNTVGDLVATITKGDYYVTKTIQITVLKQD